MTKSTALVVTVAVLACLSATGCASLADVKKEELVDRNGIDIIGSPSDRLHIIILEGGSREQFCKGPGPDIAMTASAGINVGLGGVAGLPANAKIGESIGRGAMDLGGRSPAVLLARELLYRACELALNTRIDASTTISVFKMVLDSIERISALQTGSGGVAATAAPPQAVSDLPMSLQDTPGTGVNSPAPTPAIAPAKQQTPIQP